MLGFLAILTSRLFKYPADYKALTQAEAGKGLGQTLRMKACVAPFPTPATEKTVVPPSFETLRSDLY